MLALADPRGGLREDAEGLLAFRIREEMPRVWKLFRHPIYDRVRAEARDRARDEPCRRVAEQARCSHQRSGHGLVAVRVRAGDEGDLLTVSGQASRRGVRGHGDDDRVRQSRSPDEAAQLVDVSAAKPPVDAELQALASQVHHEPFRRLLDDIATALNDQRLSVCARVADIGDPRLDVHDDRLGALWPQVVVSDDDRPQAGLSQYRAAHRRAGEIVGDHADHGETIGPYHTSR